MDWILLWKKNRMAVWVSNACKSISCLTLWSCGWLGAVAHSCCLASQERVVPHVAGGLWWMNCLFHTLVNLKNLRLNHHEVGDYPKCNIHSQHLLLRWPIVASGYQGMQEIQSWNGAWRSTAVLISAVEWLIWSRLWSGNHRYLLQSCMGFGSGVLIGTAGHWF